MTNSPVRIAFCVTDLDPGGAERALTQIVTRVDRAQWDPVVYCLSGPGELVAALESAGVPVTCFGATGLRSLGVVRRLSKAMRRDQPQLLQTFLFHANILGRLAARWAGVPHVVSGIRVAEKRANSHLLLDRLTQGLVERQVCVSQAVADFSIQQGGLDPQKIVVIPNGVDYEIFAAAEPVSLDEFGIPPESRVIVSVGRLDPQKGLSTLLRSIPAVLAKQPDVSLLLVGEGPQRAELERLVEELRLGSKVHFAGWRGDIPGILRAADLLVLSSLWEGMPNVVLEGMAAGVPVVATAVEGISELIASGENGFVATPGSTNSLSASLLEALRDPERSAAMAISAQRLVKEQFAWSEVVSKYQELYVDILKISSLETER